MNPHAALAFKLAAEMLGGVLPKATLSFLRAHMKSAERILEGTGPLATWPAKVRIVPPIVAPARDVIPSALEAILNALLEDRRIVATVRESAPRAQVTVDPLGLVFQDGVASLVCRLDEGKPRHVALSAFASARVSTEARVMPPRFDLDAFIGVGSKRRGGAKSRGRRAR